MNVDDGMRRRLAGVALLVCDVDGTLTDGAMWYGPDGEQLKRFSTRDGHGIGRLLDAGVHLALVTAEDSPIVTARAAKLRIDQVVLGCRDKGRAVRDLAAALGVDGDHTAMIGDDLGDLAGFAAVGLAVAVADAEPAVIEAAHLVTSRPGGHGAVRELADAILEARAGPA